MCINPTSYYSDQKVVCEVVKLPDNFEPFDISLKELKGRRTAVASYREFNATAVVNCWQTEELQYMYATVRMTLSAACHAARGLISRSIRRGTVRSATSRS